MSLKFSMCLLARSDIKAKPEKNRDKRRKTGKTETGKNRDRENRDREKSRPGKPRPGKIETETDRDREVRSRYMPRDNCAQTDRNARVFCPSFNLDPHHSFANNNKTRPPL